MSQQYQQIHPKSDQITSMPILNPQQGGSLPILNQLIQNQEATIQQQQQQYFQQQQQQQTNQQQLQSLQQQIIKGVEGLNILEGRMFQHSYDDLILKNCERQVSIPQIPTQPILSNIEEQRQQIDIKQSSILGTNKNTGNYQEQGSHPTRVNIQSLINIPSYNEKQESPQNILGLVSKIPSQGSSDQNMQALSQNINQIYLQNNINNQNFASNTIVSNKINNISFGQSQNNQAVQNLNFEESLQNAPKQQQVSFLNNNQQYHASQPQINPPYSQIAQNVSYMLTNIQPASHISQNINYGIVLPTNQMTFQQQQQIMQQQQLHQQQQQLQQYQKYQQTLSEQKNAIQYPVSLQSIQQFHQSQNSVIQQQQLQNQNFLNQTVNSNTPNSKNQSNLKQIDSSSLIQKQLQQDIESSQSGLLQFQGASIQSIRDINQIFFTPNNQIGQTNISQIDQNSSNEILMKKENHSTSSNFFQYYQNTSFQDNILNQLDIKDQKIINNNQDSKKYCALLQEDYQNKKIQRVTQINQNLLQQKIGKIKEEEDNSTSFRDQNNYIYSESNQQQKSSSHSINKNKYSNIKKRNSTDEKQKIDKDDEKQYMADLIIEEDSKKYIHEKDLENISQRSQEINYECFQTFNQEQTEKQKNKMLQENSQRENSKSEQKFELTDERICNISSIGGQNQRNSEIQFPKEQKSNQNSIQVKNMFPNKKRNKYFQKQREFNPQFQENQGSAQTHVIELGFKSIQGILPTKKIKKSLTDQIEGIASTTVATYAYINNENIKIMEPSFKCIQEYWPLKSQDISNVQPSLISENNNQRDANNQANSINLSQNQDYIDKSNQNQFLPKNDNLYHTTKIKENTQMSISSIPLTQNSSSFISFAQSSQITNPLNQNVQNNVELEQSLIQNQIALLSQNQSFRIESPAASQIEYAVNNAPNNINSKEIKITNLYQSQLTQQNMHTQSPQCKLKNIDEETTKNSNKIQLRNQNESQMVEMKLNSPSISLQIQNPYFEKNLQENELINKNILKSNMEIVKKQNEISIYSFLLNTIQLNFETQYKMYDNLKKKQQIQDEYLSNTLYQVQSLRKEVDDMILHSTDIQGKSGLLDFMRGRLKDLCRNNPQLLNDQNGNKLDPQTSFFSKYELVLKEGDFSEPLVKDKNFIIGVSLQDIATKKEVSNKIPIPVKLRMYTYNNPPNIFESQYIKGELCSKIIKGNCCYKKIHIKSVTSHQKNRAMFLVVEPDIEQLFSISQTQLHSAVSQIQQENNNSNLILEKNQSYEKQPNMNIKKESFFSEIEDENLQSKGMQQISKQLSLQTEDQKKQSQSDNDLKDVNFQQFSQIKKKSSRKKKDSEKSIFSSSKLDNEIIHINPLLIKPLILEQIIVKSKIINNPKS